MNAIRGFFIVIEGFDGAGKTTLVKKLEKKIVQKLEKKLGNSLANPSVTFTTSEPYGFFDSFLFDKQNNLSPLEMALFFIVDRIQHLSTIILPELKMNKIVLSDRYISSTTAYQGAMIKHWKSLLKFQEKLPKPDIEFILDVNYKTAIKRIKKRDGETVNYPSSLEYEKITNIYRKISKKPQHWLIDANRNLELVVNEVWTKLENNSLFKEFVEDWSWTRLLRLLSPEQSLFLPPIGKEKSFMVRRDWNLNLGI